MQPQFIRSCFTAFKDSSPLVHNITNDVANNTVANILLAAGASPAMVVDINEAPEFVKLAKALSINIGTLTKPTLQSMLATVEVAHNENIPWILDPVAVGASRFRRQACEQLLEFKPDVIRGNASEIMALAGINSQSKGTDSGDSVESARQAAIQLTQYSKVVVVTGSVDWVTCADANLWTENSSAKGWSIDHGHPMMTQVTAMGCALTALIAGFIGTRPTSFIDNIDPIAAATLTALCYYGQAGEIAAKYSQGPGSFYINFLDALYNLDINTLINNARLTQS